MTIKYVNEHENGIEITPMPEIDKISLCGIDGYDWCHISKTEWDILVLVINEIFESNG